MRRRVSNPVFSVLFILSLVPILLSWPLPPFPHLVSRPTVLSSPNTTRCKCLGPRACICSQGRVPNSSRHMTCKRRSRSRELLGWAMSCRRRSGQRCPYFLFLSPAPSKGTTCSGKLAGFVPVLCPDQVRHYLGPCLILFSMPAGDWTGGGWLWSHLWMVVPYCCAQRYWI